MNCTALGLSTSYKTFVGFASSSAGANFSLGTPLSSSKYIAFISLPSTSSNPTASSFTGLWTALYGAVQYVEESAVSQTSGTTPTVISSYTVPLNGWKTGDCIELEYWISGGALTANAKSAELNFLGASLFIFDFLATSSSLIVLKASVRKTSATTAAYGFEYVACNASYTLVTQGAFAYTLPSIINTDISAYTISVTGTCANGSEHIFNSYSSAKLIRS